VAQGGVAMAKKRKQVGAQEQVEAQEQLLDSAIGDSAQQIWQAGLALFAKNRQEGGAAWSYLAEEELPGTGLLRAAAALAAMPRANWSIFLTRGRRVHCIG
jgi:hypothetical protein